MKRTITTATLLALALPALAGGYGGDYGYAEVRSAVPRYEQVNTPREECWNERVYDNGGGYRTTTGPVDSYMGPVIGGLAGGLIGSVLGKGDGNKWAIGAGAVTGAIVGDRMSRRDAYVPAAPQEVRRCKVTDHWEQRVSGYDVTYQYGDRTYSAVLPYDPGPRLRVRVDVQPAE